MVRAPYFAYTGADNNAVLAQKPTGYNYDVCGAAVAFCNRTTPGASTTYNWAGQPGPFPPASNASNPPFEYSGAYCARSGNHNVGDVNGGSPLTVNGNANNAPALDAGLLRPRDPDQRVADRRRPEPVDGPDQDRLGLRLPQPQRQAVGHVRAPDQGRLAPVRDPHDRPAVHDHDRRQDHQPVRQLDPQDQHAQRRPADDGAPVHAGLPRPADPRRHRPHLLPRDPGQGHRAGRHPGQHGRADASRAPATRATR